MTRLSADSGFAFRPRARLLQLLGEQLIGSARLAVFELVKNAYDADASHVSITLAGLDTRSPSITVRDDGFGMSRETIETVWLVPGHDHKQSQRTSGQLTLKGRLPLGEKGVGRFAVHKLGTRIELVTRREDGPELTMTLDWDELSSYEYLDEARVQVEEQTPRVFPGLEHGTQITITNLRESWTRGEVRRLARQITSLSSPFGRRSDTMTTSFSVPDRENWLDDLSDITDLVDNAPWKFEFSISENYFEWQYEFRGVSGTGVTPRKVNGARIGVLLDPRTLPDPEGDRRRLAKKASESEIVSTIAMQQNIGPIRGTFFVYDRDRWVLDAMGAPLGLADYLNDNGGIRVYRDGIRVYNYGEPTDDWLGLDIRRVNAPSKRISRNIVVGAIDLDLSASVGLSEKTNREGFVESEDFTYFRSMVLGVVAQMENERNIDKEILRRVLKPAKTGAQKSISAPLEKVKQIAKSHGLLEQIEPLTEAAQNAYDEMREIMLRSGVSNMTLAVVFHEIDHGVRLLERAVEQGAPPDGILRQARDLLGLLDGFGDLLKRGDIKTIDLRVVVERAMSLNRIRLRSHHVTLETDLSAGALDSALARVPVGLVMGAITNIIDNSVYWLRTKWIDPSERAIYVGIDTESFAEGPAIIIGDTGPGFLDSFEEVTSPFFSRRPDGIGIGLYYVSMIMGLSGGSLRIIRPSDVQIPSGYEGAVLALVFKKV